MAGMQEQIRQMESVNEDMLEDAERYVAIEGFYIRAMLIWWLLADLSD